MEDAVEGLLNGMAVFGAPIVLVLDDLHTVTSPECLGLLDHAISHLPPNVRLFAVTRTDPALDLARLRVSQALVEPEQPSSRSRPRKRTTFSWRGGR